MGRLACLNQKQMNLRFRVLVCCSVAVAISHWILGVCAEEGHGFQKLVELECRLIEIEMKLIIVGCPIAVEKTPGAGG